VAALVVAWLEEDGWEVYKEVQCPRRKVVCDIFAVRRDARGRIRDSWAVEVKTHFGLDVMEQAHTWQRYAHRASIAVPRPKKRARTFGYKVCNTLGLGVIEVGPRSVAQQLTAKAGRSPKLPTLVEAQKDYEAGNADRTYWTPFKGTVEKLAALVEETPGVVLEDAVSQIDHHYKHDRSAVSSLKKHIKTGTIPDIRIVWRKSAGSMSAHLYSRTP
jgi:hypothetical protein